MIYHTKKDARWALDMEAGMGEALLRVFVKAVENALIPQLIT